MNPVFSLANHGMIPWNVVRELGGRQEPRARSLSGAVVIADVADYTALAERLSGLGDEGLGRLSDLLNRHFSRYMDVVSAHGGEMVAFSGDALIAAFLDRAGSDRAADRAVACANALAALALDAGQSAGTDRVVSHLGVASGPIWIACLGGWFGRWELLVGGEAARGAFAAAASAERGAVVIAPGTQEDTGAEPLPAPASAGEASEEFDWVLGLVHPRVLDAISVERSLASELRQVVTLFVRVTGLDEGGADAIDRYQAWIYAIHDTLRSISLGSGRFLIDHKGLVFVLVLGDPGNAHTDDLDRVLSFATELETRAGKLGLDIQMGLAAGRAFCGVIGNEWRRQYMIVGPPLNTAARLLDRAPHGLLAALPLPTYDRDRFRLTLADSLELKGVQKAVLTARLEAGASLAADPTVVRGREEEMARLQSLLEKPQHGAGGLALIVGEAGIGKSTMARWLVTHAGQAGVRCVLGEGDLTEASTPYFAFRPIVRALIGGTPRDEVQTLCDKLLHTLESIGRTAYAPLFNALLPLQLAETSTTQQFRGQRRAEALSDLLVELVRWNSKESLVILIEDAHWLDSASAGLVEQIHSRLDRPLILLTARPEAEAETLAALQSNELALRLELAPLETDAIASIACATLGKTVAPAVVSLVEKHTRGNPLFVKEYLRELRDSGQLTLAGGTWKLSGDGGARGGVSRASPTLRGLIASRIDGLPPEPRKALKIASVLGQHVDLSILSDVLDVDGTGEQRNVAGLIDAWLRHRLIIRDESSGERVIRFAHALIQTVAYESLVFDSRTNLHRAVAEAIERRQAPGLGHHALLVHHWSRARNPAKTVAHAELAAEEAVRAGAHREARAFAELCVQQASADPSLASRTRQIRWQVTLADAANGLGDVRRRGAHATQAMTLAGRHIPRTAWSAVLNGSSALLARAIRRSIVFRWMHRDDSADPVAEYVARAYRQMAQVSYFENDPFLYLCFAAQSMVNAERAQKTAELSGALAELGGIFRYAGFERVSRLYFGEAFDLAHRSRDVEAAAHVNMVHGLASVGRGKWDDAFASVERCHSLCAHTDNRVEWANAQAIRFWHHYYQSQIEEAEKAALELERTARDFGNIQQMSWGLRSRGLCRLASGENGAALHLLVRSAELLVDGTDPTGLLSTNGSVALAHSLCGDTKMGHELASRTLNQLRAIRRPMGHTMTTGLSHIAEVILGSYAQDRSSATTAVESLAAVSLLRRQAIVFPIAMPAYRYWNAMLETIGGRSGAESLRRGLAAARALGMPAEVARLAHSLQVRATPRPAEHGNG